MPPPLCTEPGPSSLGAAARLRMTPGSAESRGWRASRYPLRGTFGALGTAHLRHQIPSVPGTFGAPSTIGAPDIFSTASTFGPSASFLRLLPARDKNCEPNLAWLGDADDVPPWLRWRSDRTEPRVVRPARYPAHAFLRSSPYIYRGSEGNTGTTFGAVPSAVLHLGPALAYL